MIFEPSDVLGNIFALQLFGNYNHKGARQNNKKKLCPSCNSTQLIGEYIQSINDKMEFPISFEKLQSPNERNWRDATVRFFRDLGNRSLHTSPLIGIAEDFAYCFIGEGSYMERTAALFCNVLRMDQNFNVINEEWARYRTSQYIRLVIDDSNLYKPTPPFKEWEMELWM